MISCMYDANKNVSFFMTQIKEKIAYIRYVICSGCCLDNVYWIVILNTCDITDKKVYSTYESIMSIVHNIPMIVESVSNSVCSAFVSERIVSVPIPAMTDTVPYRKRCLFDIFLNMVDCL